MTDQHEGSEKYRRSGGLCQRAKTPPRALPGDTAAFWAEGKRTSEHRNDTKVAFVDKSGTSHGKIFFRTEDNVWATRDVVDEAHRKKVTAASEVQAVAKREVQIKAARAKAEREAALVPTKDMFATQGVPPRSKSHLEGLPTPAEERESRHLDAIDGWHIKGTKKREGKQVRVHTVQNEINKHDQGETRYEPRVEMKVADAKYRAQYRKGLDAEVEQRAAARAAEREAERATSKNEQGYTAQLGRWGCGAPNVNEDGTVMAKLPVSIAHVPIPRAEEGYVETIEQQIAEQREARERLDAAHRFQKHEVFDPFQKTKDKHKPHKTIAGQHGMADVAGAPIDGSSLANVMGTPGGGAPVQHGDNADRHPMAEDQLEAQYKLELQAQKEGRSQWGKQGCGAPLRTKEGAIVRSSRGAAEGDTNGVNDYKRTHNLRRAQKKVLEDQTQFLATMHERRKKEAAEDRRLEDEAIRVGGVMGRTQEEKKTAKRAPGFFDPPPPRRNADAKVLDKQLAEKKQAQRRQKEVDDALAATHNAVAMEWVGKGQGEVKRHP